MLQPAASRLSGLSRRGLAAHQRKYADMRQGHITMTSHQVTKRLGFCLRNLRGLELQVRSTVQQANERGKVRWVDAELERENEELLQQRDELLELLDASRTDFIKLLHETCTRACSRDVVKVFNAFRDVFDAPPQLYHMVIQEAFYKRFCSLDDAKLVMDALKRAEVGVLPETLSMMISFASAACDLRVAERMFREMQVQDIVPSKSDMISMLTLNLVENQYTRSVELVKMFRELGYEAPRKPFYGLTRDSPPVLPMLDLCKSIAIHCYTAGVYDDWRMASLLLHALSNAQQLEAVDELFTTVFQPHSVWPGVEVDDLLSVFYIGCRAGMPAISNAALEQLRPQLLGAAGSAFYYSMVAVTLNCEHHHESLALFRLGMARGEPLELAPVQRAALARLVGAHGGPQDVRRFLQWIQESQQLNIAEVMELTGLAVHKLRDPDSLGEFVAAMKADRARLTFVPGTEVALLSRMCASYAVQKSTAEYRDRVIDLVAMVFARADFKSVFDGKILFADESFVRSFSTSMRLLVPQLSHVQNFRLFRVVFANPDLDTVFVSRMLHLGVASLKPSTGSMNQVLAIAEEFDHGIPYSVNEILLKSSGYVDDHETARHTFGRMFALGQAPNARVWSATLAAHGKFRNPEALASFQWTLDTALRLQVPLKLEVLTAYLVFFADLDDMDACRAVVDTIENQGMDLFSQHHAVHALLEGYGRADDLANLRVIATFISQSLGRKILVGWCTSLIKSLHRLDDASDMLARLAADLSNRRLANDPRYLGDDVLQDLVETMDVTGAACPRDVQVEVFKEFMSCHQSVKAESWAALRAYITRRHLHGLFQEVLEAHCGPTNYGHRYRAYQSTISSYLNLPVPVPVPSPSPSPILHL